MNKSHRHLTALAYMLETPEGPAYISVQSIRKDLKLGAALSEILIDPTTGELLSGSLSKVLSAIRGGALGHYQQPRIPTLLNQTLIGHGLLALDNPIRDFSILVTNHLATRFDQDVPSLKSLAARHGIPARDISGPQDNLSSGLEIMARLYREIWARLSGFSATIPENTKPLDTSKYDTFIPPHLPLPTPFLPEMSEPAGGWRRSAWSELERRAVARDFCSGELMENISHTYLRSPRAILSRLIIDGLTQK